MPLPEQSGSVRALLLPPALGGLRFGSAALDPATNRLRGFALSLRQYLTDLERDFPSEVIRVKGAIDPGKFEATAVLQRRGQLRSSLNRLFLIWPVTRGPSYAQFCTTIRQQTSSRFPTSSVAAASSLGACPQSSRS